MTSFFGLWSEDRWVERRGRERTRGRTGFEVNEVLNQVLHQLILRDHVPLEVHHLANHRLVVLTEVTHVLLHRELSAREVLKLSCHPSVVSGGEAARTGVGTDGAVLSLSAHTTGTSSSLSGLLRRRCFALQEKRVSLPSSLELMEGKIRDAP